MRKPSVWPILVLAAATLVGGCNTMRGVGKDVEAAGRTIQKTVDKAD